MGLARFIGDLFSPSGRRSARSNDSEDPRHRLGREGERLAERHLRRHGYKILYRNFRAPRGGEVDLVCRDKSCDTLAFVEVKTRRSEDFGTPAEAVNREKQVLIARGAMAWLRLLEHPEINIRFDIVEILVSESGPDVRLIKNAFPLPKPYF